MGDVSGDRWSPSSSPLATDLNVPKIDIGLLVL